MYPVSEEEREAAREFLPPVVYLPAGLLDEEIAVEFRPLGEGGKALLAYTALDRLARSLGPNQAWVMVQTKKLQDIYDEQDCRAMYFDLPLPREMWSNRGLR